MREDQKKEMCGETEIIGGEEFICVLEFHGREWENGVRQPLRNSRGGYRKWARHWFTRKYPYGGSTH